MNSNDKRCAALIVGRNGSNVDEYHRSENAYVAQACLINLSQVVAFFVAVHFFAHSRAFREALAPRRKPNSARELRACVRETLWQCLHDIASDLLLENRDPSIVACSSDDGRCGGIDALVMLRLCRLGFRFSLLGSVLGMILIPVYASGGADAPGFLQYTILNVDGQDVTRSWVVVCMACLMAIIALTLMQAEWHSFTKLRHAHLKRRAQGKEGASAAQAQHSLIIENVPEDAQNNKERLTQLFEGLFGSVHSCVLQTDTAEIHRQLALQEAKGQLLCCSDSCGCCRLTHAGLDFSIRHVAKLEKYTLTWFRMVQAANHPTSTAFVTLRKVRDQAIAGQVLLFKYQAQRRRPLADGGCLILPAPEARDIVWENISIPRSVVDQRQKLGAALTVAGLVGWTAPLTAIQGLANASQFEKRFPWLDAALIDQPLVHNFVTGYIPVILLMLLQATVPRALARIALHVEGQKLYSEIEREVLRRHFRFQLASLYITVFSCSLWKSLVVVVEHPICLATILGKSTPTTAVYFLTFVIAQCGTGLLLVFAQPLVSLVTRREDSASPIYFSFASEGCDVGLVLVLALTYSVICPAILPACALYFSCASFTYRWLFQNVYMARFDSTGLFWCDLFDNTMLGLLFSTLALAGLLATFESSLVVGVQILWGLMFVIGYHHHRWNAFYGPVCRAMPLEDAAEVDEDEEGSRCVTTVFLKDYYLDPVAKQVQDDVLDSTQEIHEADYGLSPSAIIFGHPVLPVAATSSPSAATPTITTRNTGTGLMPLRKGAPANSWLCFGLGRFLRW